jgi:N-acetylglucosaminyldiphosphoundecaprenol N-acetyl-beta-D-mannosaminyltransferase
MQRYFNIKFEFDRETFNREIHKIIVAKKKGYVCVVDGNVLAHASNSESYKNILNNSIVNSCDGSSIALIAGLIHKKKLQTYTGHEIFEDFIDSEFSQLFLGNAGEVLEKLKIKFIQKKIDLNNKFFYPLPFNDVSKFDYLQIAKDINKLNPQIIWVSLGAPKQEIFMSKLLYYINSGVLFGIGAAVNFYINDGPIKRAPLWLRKLHLEWLFRVCQEPKRIGKRAMGYFFLLPKIIINEILKKELL